MVLPPGNERFASILWQAGLFRLAMAGNAGGYTGRTSELSISSVS